MVHRNGLENLRNMLLAVLLHTMPLRIAILLLASVLLLASRSQFSVECTPNFLFNNFDMESGYSLVGNITSTRTAGDFVDCTFVCSADPWCFSFNFGRNLNENLFTCEISDSVKDWDPQNFQSRPGFDYYSKVVSCISGVNLVTCKVAKCSAVQ